ncbi:MAG: leucine-rich repeat protein [Clostridia bacterium]|nr:leucine-rich repeat protein [Clostridia bacterium]
MKKKILSIILSLAIFTTFLSIVASAADSGNFGQNIMWTLDDNGTLIISGTGGIGAVGATRSPFYKNSNIKFVVVENGITCIENYAFDECSSLISVNLPDSVTKIGGSAFSGCSSLTDITIPDSVTSIGGSAFSGCSSLTDITIPDSVTSIDGSVFSGCSSLKNINVSENNKDYCSINGNLFSKDKTELLRYAIGKGDTSYTIPDSVTSIGMRAFLGCSSLTDIVIPDSVISIRTNAFGECSSLTSIAIPNSVTELGVGVFNGCISLSDISVSESNNDYCSINGNLFSKNKMTLIQYAIGKKDTSYTIPDSVTSIGERAFLGCSSLTDIIIPNSVTSIGEWAFSYCDSLISIKIPSGITSIEDYTFSSCHNLTSVKIPDSVTKIGCFAFSSCHSLKSIVIPKSVTSIGSTIGDMSFGSTFQNCHSLTNIMIPSSVTQIYDYSFYGCESLTDIYYGGNETQWKNMLIGNENTVLANCNIHYNSSPITVLLNNASLEFDVMPQIINGSTMVPLRTIFEALGASVEWDESTRTVTSLKGDTRIKLTIDEDIMYVNDKAVVLNTSACIINGRTLVPVRAISEAYGAKVDWNGDTQTVLITN